jgi:hypothetical protein
MAIKVKSVIEKNLYWVGVLDDLTGDINAVIEKLKKIKQEYLEKGYFDLFLHTTYERWEESEALYLGGYRWETDDERKKRLSDARKKREAKKKEEEKREEAERELYEKLKVKFEA